MKTIIFFLLLFVLFSAFECQHQEDIEPSSENQAIVIGKWQLVEYYWSAGGPGYWTKADPAKPDIIEFKADGEYISGRENCSGRYTAATSQEIMIKISCSTGYVQQSEHAGKILPSGELVLEPTKPMCIEGCSEKYKRIK